MLHARPYWESMRRMAHRRQCGGTHLAPGCTTSSKHITATSRSWVTAPRCPSAHAAATPWSRPSLCTWADPLVVTPATSGAAWAGLSKEAGVASKKDWARAVESDACAAAALQCNQGAVVNNSQLVDRLRLHCCRRSGDARPVSTAAFAARHGMLSQRCNRLLPKPSGRLHTACGHRMLEQHVVTGCTAEAPRPTGRE